MDVDGPTVHRVLRLRVLKLHSQAIGRSVIVIGWLALGMQPASANSATETCMREALKTATSDTTVGELRAMCALKNATEAQRSDENSLLMQRLRRERSAEETRSVLVPHRRNYLIPVSYNRRPNDEPFDSTFGDLLSGESLDRFEAKFQLSLKFSLADGFFTELDELFAGFSAKSFWQVYNKDVSAPFRETNYEPEIFWVTPLKWRPFGVDASLFSVGFTHESNGRGGGLSRSWNRVYANFVLERNRFVFSLKPWWRVPEEEKNGPLDASGDDNPDIEKFMGNFEFTTLYRRGQQEFGLTLRNNLRSDNKGAIQFDWTFPMWRGIRGYAQFFNGYGESLIDYNARSQRIGVGILLTDLL